MAYDPDLTTLLGGCTNEDLDPLVRYILSARTNSLDSNDIYKQYAGFHERYVPLIVKEVREFGGNSLLNVFRDAGVPYAEVVRDVADKLSAKYDDTDSVAQIEVKVLTKILESSIERMGPEELGALEDQFRAAGAKHVDLRAGAPIAGIMAQVGVQMSGFLAYQVAVIVANAVARIVLGRGLTLATNAALTRAIGVLAGPIGWAITGIWTLIDVSGPAYRVTIPAVCHIAFLRLKKDYGAVGAA
jgi:uncharacterized protein YaaW (UPF0174 family)